MTHRLHIVTLKRLVVAFGGILWNSTSILYHSKELLYQSVLYYDTPLTRCNALLKYCDDLVTHCGFLAAFYRDQDMHFMKYFHRILANHTILSVNVTKFQK